MYNQLIFAYKQFAAVMAESSRMTENHPGDSENRVPEFTNRPCMRSLSEHVVVVINGGLLNHEPREYKKKSPNRCTYKQIIIKNCQGRKVANIINK